LSTLLYFQQTELIPATVSDSAERTRLLAFIDVAVNVIALLLQLLAFGAMIERLGTTFTLAALPAVAIVGFAALALAPVLSTLVVFGVLRRAGEYAISKPARETCVPPGRSTGENVIDTLVHRTGDTASSWIFAGLKSAGLTLTGMSWVAVPIAAMWMGVAVFLGRAADARRRAVPVGAGAQGAR
jgi:AAA family ATP:ADP antiporter